EMRRNGKLEEFDRAGGPDAPKRNSSASSNDTKEATRLLTMCQLAGEMDQIKAEDIDPGVSLLALGLDSLMMTNLRFRFEERLALSVPLESMLCGRSLRELAEEAEDISSSRPHNLRETGLPEVSSEEYSLSTGQ